jgi:zinc protease
VAGLPPAFIGDYVGLVQRVTATQVQAMARKYYAPGSHSIVVVGDPGVAPQLQPYGEFRPPSP